jgi:hypothetical protein
LSFRFAKFELDELLQKRNLFDATVANIQLIIGTKAGIYSVLPRVQRTSHHVGDESSARKYRARRNLTRYNSIEDLLVGEPPEMRHEFRPKESQKT